MSTQPNQGKNPDQDSYDGYSGYHPRRPADDPYGAYSGSQQGTTTGTTGTSSQQSDPNYAYGQRQQQGQSYSSSSSQQQQQQSSTYQPPSSVAGKNSSSSGQPSTGLQSNHAAALSYVFLWFSGIFFLFWKRHDQKARFNAAQSVVVFLPLFIIAGVFSLLASLPIIGWLIAVLWGLISGVIFIPIAILWLFLIVQAFLGNEVRLPFVGQYAEKLSGFFAPRRKKVGK